MYVSYIIIAFALLLCTGQDIAQQGSLVQLKNNKQTGNLENNLKEKHPILKASSNTSNSNSINNNKTVTNTSQHLNTTSPNTRSQVGNDIVNLEESGIGDSGAISRAILVFVALSFLFILYVGFQTYRKKKLGRSQMVLRKYGVRTRRSDIEMEPLPLSDDNDDDETLFDLSASRNTNNLNV
ncbi:hypothetical protein ABEB36_003642 [Hypothenemus hampei]|uniref:Uncharacterized protein n=1 Tax=Hypothenemus hampei TaxID=57062 RepID=A0ABD1F9V7_HYPHA